MKKLFLLLVMCGCSHFQQSPVLSESEHEVPEWVYAPYEGCSEADELCATGEGKTYNQADAQAKINLGSIFEVKVQSDLSVTSSSSQTFPWQSQVKEEVLRSLNESVSQILENVEVKKHFRKEGLSYALASLDRSEAGDLIGSRLKKIDEELNTLWATRQRTLMRRMVKLYLEREKLNERYSIVTGSPRPSSVTWEEIVKWRRSRPKVEPLVLKIGQAPDWLREKLTELLTESGFKLVKGNASKALELQVDSIKEYLNVKGFEKYTFTLNLTSLENGEKKKVISTSETVNGRSQADALLKVKNNFIEYIEQHLSDLHLD